MEWLFFLSIKLFLSNLCNRLTQSRSLLGVGMDIFGVNFDFSDIISLLVGGVPSYFIGRYVQKNKASGNANISDQSGSSAGGDISGRDKITKS